MVRLERPLDFYITYGNCHVHYAVVFVCLGWIFACLSEFMRCFDHKASLHSWYHFPMFIVMYILALIGNRKVVRWCYIPIMVLNGVASLAYSGQALVHFVVLALELIEQSGEKSFYEFISEDRTDEIRFTMEGSRYFILIIVTVYSLRVMYRDYLYLRDVVGKPDANLPPPVVDL
ncbi:unnamed protein product [Bursaphelenchus xylophilus]|uniref:(pine wood nematode) hypothetical protein n=1 Tax=Bursaphelenchus xylophilus TaxID=6326 RepID=A0A1I7SBD9_BURXY|nr:unnamed protein product [Bursaphelenchus xylophilus]CAG9131955.1 unnamed protein product [Bursaphelenchus xylophilus]